MNGNYTTLKPFKRNSVGLTAKETKRTARNVTF
jgi:hypothetical protein